MNSQKPSGNDNPKADDSAEMAAIREWAHEGAFMKVAPFPLDYMFNAMLTALDERDKRIAAFPENPKLLRLIDRLETELNEWKAISERMAEEKTVINNMLDQLPDPDQHPHDLQADYRAWLHDFDKDLP